MSNLSRSLTDFEGFVLPEPNNDDAEMQLDGGFYQPGQPRVIREQLAISARAAAEPERQYPFNDDQHRVFEAVREAARDTNNGPRLFFVDGPGGTGKTYLFNALLTSIRRSGDIALAVASSGTAALLLDGGRTAHSRFNIPLQVDQHSMCRITPRSSTAQLIRMAKLIIWDEASMVSRHVFDTVSRSCQDVMKLVDPDLEQVPFGGKLIVFGGDFRQLLPVLPRGTRAQIVDQCMNRSVFWRHVRTLESSMSKDPINRLTSSSNSLIIFCALVMEGSPQSTHAWCASPLIWFFALQTRMI